MWCVASSLGHINTCLAPLCSPDIGNGDGTTAGVALFSSDFLADKVASTSRSFGGSGRDLGFLRRGRGWCLWNGRWTVGGWTARPLFRTCWSRTLSARREKLFSQEDVKSDVVCPAHVVAFANDSNDKQIQVNSILCRRDLSGLSESGVCCVRT